jgi:hypothetical protein
MGYGPGTGRGLGPCGGGLYRGRGYSAGWNGFGRRFISPKNEMLALDEEEKLLEAELQAIKEEKAALKGRRK